jgi:thioesterase domain-containing protein
MSLPKLTAYLHEEFPLTRAMQVAVAAWDHQTLTLKAPLAPNINHAETAFGGSISTLGILAGYTLLHHALEDRSISNRILIQKSSTDFFLPIDTNMTITATLPAANVVEEFLTTLQKKRRARITLTSEIRTNQTPAATHTGLYVAILY